MLWSPKQNANSNKQDSFYQQQDGMILQALHEIHNIQLTEVLKLVKVLTKSKLRSYIQTKYFLQKSAVNKN